RSFSEPGDIAAEAAAAIVHIPATKHVVKAGTPPVRCEPLDDLAIYPDGQIYAEYFRCRGAPEDNDRQGVPRFLLSLQGSGGGCEAFHHPRASRSSNGSTYRRGSYLQGLSFSGKPGGGRS